MFLRFKDRAEGGRALAAELSEYKNRQDVVVLALPRGGVPVAYEVAMALEAPLDILLVRKLGVPSREELAFGAIASGPVTILNRSLVEAFRIPDSLIRKVIKRERIELARREKAYRTDGAAINLLDKTVIIVDDGLATGATMRVAVKAVRGFKPKQIIVAVPVASYESCEGIKQAPDNLCVCVMKPKPFNSVGMWYRGFDQTTDSEVCRLIGDASHWAAKEKYGTRSNDTMKARGL